MVTVTFNMQGHGSPTPDVQHLYPIVYPSEILYPADDLYPSNGSKATRPPDPSESGYDFDGWFNEPECTSEFDFNTEITANKTLYAKWTQKFTVTFNMHGHGTQIASREVRSGSTTSAPENPSADYYIFGGWYEDAGFTTAFDFTSPIVNNTEIHAKWTAVVYTITYNLAGGTAVNPATYTVETPTFTLNNPTKSGKEFSGWIETGQASVMMTVTIPIGSHGNREYTATYGVSVLFDTLGRSFPPVKQTPATGSTATKPVDPVCKGYKFVNWFTSLTESTPFDFSTPIMESLTLYARWEEDKSAINVDWSQSMKQTYEFYKVDPNSFKDLTLVSDIESCTINRDLSSDTLGSANFECSSEFEECYIRVYMLIIQNGIKYRYCLGTYLVQTPEINFDGKRKKITMDGYTSLIELKNGSPSIGYTIRKNENVMKNAFYNAIDNMRAPVVEVVNDKTLYDHFVANSDDTWFSFISDLIALAEYSFKLEPTGQVIFEPYKKYSARGTVWVYTDDNSSILLPDISDEKDLYSIPNVVEVVYSNDSATYISRAVNDDPDSPISVTNRGREVLYRDTNPSVTENMAGEQAQQYLDEYAKEELKSLSTLQHTVTYSHGYCPVNIGDGVILNYKSAGLVGVKAVVTSQSFKCEAGCTVEETASYTTNLYGEDVYITHRISYVTFYGKIPEHKHVSKVYYLTTLDLPTLTATDHTFAGWYYDYDYESEAHINDEITENVTLYAKWS